MHDDVEVVEMRTLCELGETHDDAPEDGSCPPGNERRSSPAYTLYVFMSFLREYYENRMWIDDVCIVMCRGGEAKSNTTYGVRTGLCISIYFRK